ncbi:MAG: hypothetical protein MUC50_19050 [Myxococcota bacterium]|nr:hypothetical protein [Myxococcota bacterium]
MRKKEPPRWLFCIVGLFFLPLCCLPDEADRCRDGFVLEGPNCVPVDDDSASQSASDGGEESDSSTDTEELPSGNGDPCETSDDCAGKLASYCFEVPGIGKTCVISDCLGNEDKCPVEQGFVCCEFSMDEALPSMCVPIEIFTALKDVLGC